MSVIIELNQPISVETPIGKGIVIFIVDYGWSSNMVWTVALEDGLIRHFQTTQLKMLSDHAWGINYPRKTI